jgi:hypothetical protein
MPYIAQQALSRPEKDGYVSPNPLVCNIVEMASGGDTTSALAGHTRKCTAKKPDRVPKRRTLC